MRPKGASRFARSREGLVYVSPSFNQAAEYSFMRRRDDWAAQDRSQLADGAYVFEFAMSDNTVELEEDELGFALKTALCIQKDRPHHWSMNDGFARAVVDDGEIRAALCDLGHRLLGPDEEKLARPDLWKAAFATSLAKKALLSIDHDLALSLVESGISVASSEEVFPVAAYRLPSRVMKAEDAEEIWRTSVPALSSAPGLR